MLPTVYAISATLSCTEAMHEGEIDESISPCVCQELLKYLVLHCSRPSAPFRCAAGLSEPNLQILTDRTTETENDLAGPHDDHDVAGIPVCVTATRRPDRNSLHLRNSCFHFHSSPRLPPGLHPQCLA